MADAARSDRVPLPAAVGLALIALAGGVLLVDGSLHGELRHRLLGVGVGALLCVPLVSVLIRGGRALGLWKRVGISAVTGIAALGALEVATRIFDLRAFTVPVVEPHPILGQIHTPGRGGIDDWGFRNRRVPDRADVVFLGDSQTFGTNIRREDNYPSVFGRSTGLEVYNMSNGGFGPIQYRAMTERALGLQPKAIVVGFYFGNDLVDAHRFAGLEPHADLQDPELDYPVPDDASYGDLRSLNLTMALFDGLTSGSRVLETLSYELKLGLKTSPFFTDLYWEAGQRHNYEKGKIRTLLAPDYRRQQVRMDRVAVRDGMRITGLCFDRMAKECSGRGVELFLLLIHTKEYCYARLLESRGEPEAESLAEVRRAEAEATERVLELARRAEMSVVDPEPAVLRALAADTALWPQGPDGHLNRAGCRLFAGVLRDELAEETSLISARH